MLQADQESWSLVIVHVDPDALTGVLPLAGHEVVVRGREAILSRAWPRVHLVVSSSSLSSVKAGVSEWVGRGGGWWMVLAPGQTVGVAPAVPLVALSRLPPAHLLILALEPIISVVVLEGRGAHGPAVVLPLRLSQQLLLQNMIVQMYINGVQFMFSCSVFV